MELVNVRRLRELANESLNERGDFFRARMDLAMEGGAIVLLCDEVEELQKLLNDTFIDAAALRLTAMREALVMIRDIASGSTTANTLPHIAKIAERAILAGSDTSTR